MLTNQEIFDKVAKHLISQGRRSTSGDTDICMYRGDNGTKCAVGVLIEDDEYDPKFEGVSVLFINERFNVKFKNFRTRNLQLIRGLQSVHDHACNWVTPDTLKDSLRELAKGYRLNAGAI